MADPHRSAPASRRRAALELLVYGVAAGLLVVVLELTELRFLVVERSVEIYGTVVAVIFAGLGLWLGLSLRQRRLRASAPEAPGTEPFPVDAPGTEPFAVGAPGTEPFVVDQERRAELGITDRELEILGLVAAGLSNREIGERLFISENTVKTHASRVLDKLGARRRTEAVRLGRAARLIP